MGRRARKRQQTIGGYTLTPSGWMLLYYAGLYQWTTGRLYLVPRRRGGAAIELVGAGLAYFHAADRQVVILTPYGLDAWAYAYRWVRGKDPPGEWITVPPEPA